MIDIILKEKILMRTGQFKCPFCLFLGESAKVRHVPMMLQNLDRKIVAHEIEEKRLPGYPPQINMDEILTS